MLITQNELEEKLVGYVELLGESPDRESCGKLVVFKLAPIIHKLIVTEAANARMDARRDLAD